MTKLSSYLYKKAAQDNLDPDASKFRIRHLMLPALLAALQGMDVDSQILANWDSLKLGAAKLGGGLLGGLAGAGLGYGLGKYLGKDKHSGQLGTVIGFLGGGLIGTPLGSYVLLKHLATKRKLKEGKPSWANGFGMLSSAALALNGASYKQQEDANYDAFKLGVTKNVAGNLVENYLGKGYSLPAAIAAGAIYLDGVTHFSKK